MDADFSKLKRSLQEMPEDVLKALEEHQLLEAYRSRPAYQQNDYLAWIARAKREVTRLKRLQQMLDELQAGGVYMGMTHGPSRRNSN